MPSYLMDIWGSLSAGCQEADTGSHLVSGGDTTTILNLQNSLWAFEAALSELGSQGSLVTTRACLPLELEAKVCRAKGPAQDRGT